MVRFLAAHTGVLWTLETVAWRPEHFGRAALLVARLARLGAGSLPDGHSVVGRPCPLRARKSVPGCPRMPAHHSPGNASASA